MNDVVCEVLDHAPPGTVDSVAMTVMVKKGCIRACLKNPSVGLSVAASVFDIHVPKDRGITLPQCSHCGQKTVEAIPNARHQGESDGNWIPRDRPAQPCKERGSTLTFEGSPVFRDEGGGIATVGTEEVGVSIELTHVGSQAPDDHSDG
ncbi:MAG: hypothetical protein RI935_73 [Candidatus Parcubacteria bacterium]